MGRITLGSNGSLQPTYVVATSASGVASVQPEVQALLNSVTAMDNVDGTVAVTNNSPAIFPVNQGTIVTFSARDAAGNTATQYGWIFVAPVGSIVFSGYVKDAAGVPVSGATPMTNVGGMASVSSDVNGYFTSYFDAKNFSATLTGSVAFGIRGAASRTLVSTWFHMVSGSVTLLSQASQFPLATAPSYINAQLVMSLGGIVRVNVPAGQSGSITLFNNVSQEMAGVTTTADVVVPAGSYSLRYQPSGYADPFFWNGAAQTFDPSASRPIAVSAGQVYVATFTAAQMTDAQVSALAVQRMNYYRALVGLTPVIEDVNLRQAALNHANYWYINRNDPSVAGLGAHNETVGFARFTGASPQNRYAFVAGISPTTWYVSEDMYFGLYPVLATVDGWMNTVYHQLPIMDNMLLYAGMGRYYQGTAGSTTLNMGIGFPVVARSLYVYPANGQQDVFAQFSGGEMPDPLLNSGLTYPVGSPISMYAPGHILTINSASLQEAASGAALGVLTLNSATDPNGRLNASTVFFIPRLPLKPQTSYIVTVTYSLDGGVATNYAWRFTTGWQ